MTRSTTFVGRSHGWVTGKSSAMIKKLWMISVISFLLPGSLHKQTFGSSTPWAPARAASKCLESNLLLSIANQRQVSGAKPASIQLIDPCQLSRHDERGYFWMKLDKIRLLGIEVSNIANASIGNVDVLNSKGFRLSDRKAPNATHARPSFVSSSNGCQWSIVLILLISLDPKSNPSIRLREPPEVYLCETQLN